jgi:hypothetical protein
MARQRTTFGKMQRAADKREKAKAKKERRAARADAEPDTSSEVEPSADQETVLAAFADLHVAFEEGRVDLDEFETRKAALTRLLRVD